MLKLQMLDDFQVGTVAGTVWALCGHCVGTASTVPAHIYVGYWAGCAFHP